MGFALVTGPFFVLLLGPRHGVILVNLCGVLTAALVLLRVRRDIEWKTYLWLAIPAVIGIMLGAILATRLDAHWLEFAVGTIMLLALLLAMLARRVRTTVSGPIPRIAAGFVSGVASAAAGTSGPPISVYAVMSRWPQRSFAATMQPYFLTTGLGSVIGKLAWEPELRPEYPWWAWALILLGLVAGTSLGDRLARFLRAEHARAAMLALAAIGSLAVAVHGLSQLIG